LNGQEMEIKAQELIREFVKEYPISKKPLKRWKTIVEGVIWKTPADVKATFASVSFVGKTTIFNIGGNKWRLLSYIEYEERMVIVTHVLSHKQYDNIKIA
jgi:mRNA interferase HigB